MKAIEFPEQNCVHKADGCLDLPTCVKMNEQFQTQEVISCWELEDEDIVKFLQQIKSGERPCILLAVVGGQPPVWLGVRTNRESC